MRLPQSQYIYNDAGSVNGFLTFGGIKWVCISR